MLATTIEADPFLGRILTGRISNGVVKPNMTVKALSRDGKMIEQGRIPRDEEIVVCITGNGLKTQDAVEGVLAKPTLIGTSLEEFEPFVESGTVGALA